MSSLFYLPRQFVVDGSGSPRAGAKLFFYEAGTLTDQDTYSDNALSTPNTNPVVADSAGVFGPIFLQNDDYRVILKDSADVQIWDQDNVNSPLVGLFGANAQTKNGNYTVVAGDKGNLIEFTATATVSLLAVATASAGFTRLTLMVLSRSMALPRSHWRPMSGQYSRQTDRHGRRLSFLRRRRVLPLLMLDRLLLLLR